MTEYKLEDGKAIEDLRLAVNSANTVLNRIRTLESALEKARSSMRTLADGISPNAYRMAYNHAKAEKYTDFAAKAVQEITEVLGR